MFGEKNREIQRLRDIIIMSNVDNQSAIESLECALEEFDYIEKNLDDDEELAISASFLRERIIEAMKRIGMAIEQTID